MYLTLFNFKTILTPFLCFDIRVWIKKVWIESNRCLKYVAGHNVSKICIRLRLSFHNSRFALHAVEGASLPLDIWYELLNLFLWLTFYLALNVSGLTYPIWLDNQGYISYVRIYSIFKHKISVTFYSPLHCRNKTE